MSLSCTGLCQHRLLVKGHDEQANTVISLSWCVFLSSCCHALPGVLHHLLGGRGNSINNTSCVGSGSPVLVSCAGAVVGSMANWFLFLFRLFPVPRSSNNSSITATAAVGTAVTIAAVGTAVTTTAAVLTAVTTAAVGTGIKTAAVLTTITATAAIVQQCRPDSIIILGLSS